MKDLVEHIRTVHFTILVVALVLIAATKIENRRSIQRAAVDADAILHLSERWELTTNSLDQQFNKKALEDLDPHYDGVYYYADGPYPGTLDLTSEDEKARFKLKRAWFPVHPLGSPEKGFVTRATDELNHIGDVDEQFSKWKTLKEFITFWDDFHNGKLIVLPIILDFDRKNPKCGRLSRAVAAMDPTHYFDAKAKKHIEKSNRDEQLWDVEGSLYDLESPRLHPCQLLGTGFKPIDVKNPLITAFGSIAEQSKVWGTGDSKVVFYDILEASKHLEDTPLSDLSQHLKARADEETDKVELFQVKLPASTIPTFGSLILLLCMFYLLAHLVELRKVSKETEADDSAIGYIGLYEFRAAFIFTVISLTVFPATPLIMESHKYEGFLRYGAIAASVIALTLGICCSATLWRIRTEMSTPKIADSASVVPEDFEN